MTGPASGTVGAHPSLDRAATPVVRLTRRAEFVRVAKGRRWHGKALTLQAATRDPADAAPDGARVGFTLTKKVGCAVVRNRARRRLREAVRLSPELPVRGDHDYVVVGRLDAIRLSFDDLRAELARAVCAVHDRRARAGGPGRHRRTASRDVAETGQGPQDARRADPVGSAPERTVSEP